MAGLMNSNGGSGSGCVTSRCGPNQPHRVRQVSFTVVAPVPMPAKSGFDLAATCVSV